MTHEDDEAPWWFWLLLIVGTLAVVGLVGWAGVA